MKKWCALALALMLFLPLALAETPAPQGLFAVADAPALREIALGQEAGEPSFIAVQGTDLLVMGFAQEGLPLRLTLWDLQTDRALGRTAFSYGDDMEARLEMGFLEDGRAWAISGASLYILDRSLAVQQEVALRQEELYADTLLSPDGSRLWSASADGTRLTGRSLQGEHEIDLRMAIDGDWNFMGFRGIFGGELVFSYFKLGAGEQRFRYSLADGTMRPQRMMAGLDPLEGEDRSFALRGTLALFSKEGSGEDLRRIGAWHREESLMDAQGDLVLAGNYQAEAALRLFDLGRGQVIAQLPAQDAATSSLAGAALCPALHSVLMLGMDNDSGRIRLLAWDYAAQPLALDAQVTQVTAASFREANDAAARDLEARYGISVYLRERGAGFQDGTYRGVTESSELNTAQALQSLEAFLGLLPPGMVQEMVVPPYDSLAFYLSGGIERVGEGGIDMPDGFTSSWNNERFLVVSTVNLGDMRTLAHELMHVLEDRLEQLPADSKGRYPLENFLRLSPAGFKKGGYAYSYFGADGFALNAFEYTPGTDRKGQTIYYLDGYSRTFPIEDRARLFENLFISQDHLAWGLENERVMRKAQYLSYLLRQAFPSVQQVPKAYWETMLPAEDIDWDSYFTRNKVA